MTKLIGSETSPTPTEGTIERGKIIVCKFTAVAEGTVEAITIKLGVFQAGTEAWLGIYEDAAGFPGRLLEQRKTLAFGAGERLLEQTGFNVTVGAGTAYWLAAKAVRSLPAQPLRPITNTAGEATERQSVTSAVGGLLELPEAEWTALMFGGPQSFFGTGTLAPPHSAGLVEARQKGGNA